MHRLVLSNQSKVGNNTKSNLSIELLRSHTIQSMPNTVDLVMIYSYLDSSLDLFILISFLDSYVFLPLFSRRKGQMIAIFQIKIAYI